MDENKENSVEQTQATDKNVETVEAPKEAETKTFTEKQVEEIVQRRLERERNKVSKKLDGVDLDEAKKLLEEKKTERARTLFTAR